MDEKQVLQTFSRKKILTIDQLVDLLQCSVITVRRGLKQWSAFTSINKNGRYYTLPRIPLFDENGLWRYQTVLFSNHGNLTQSIYRCEGGFNTGRIYQTSRHWHDPTFKKSQKTKQTFGSSGHWTFFTIAWPVKKTPDARRWSAWHDIGRR